MTTQWWQWWWWHIGARDCKGLLETGWGRNHARPAFVCACRWSLSQPRQSHILSDGIRRHKSVCCGHSCSACSLMYAPNAWFTGSPGLCSVCTISRFQVCRCCTILDYAWERLKMVSTAASCCNTGIISLWILVSQWLRCIYIAIYYGKVCCSDLGFLNGWMVPPRTCMLNSISQTLSKVCYFVCCCIYK